VLKRLIASFVLLMLLANSSLAYAQANSWGPPKKTVTHTASGVSAPTKFGELVYKSAQTFSNPGSGLDTAGQWKSADGLSAATLYVYMPTLADTALMGLATNQAILDRFGASVKISSDSLITMGTTKNAARRIDYDGGKLDEQDVWTSAVFLKTGDWLVKIRLSGPQSKAASLRIAMNILLKNMRFAKNAPPLPYPMMTVTACTEADRDNSGATIVPARATDIAAQASVIIGVDFNARSDSGQRVAIRRMPNAVCLDRIRLPNGLPISIMRPVPGGTKGLLTELGLIVILNDNGTLLEISRVNPNKNEFLMIFHNVAEAALLPMLDRPLSERQIIDLFANPKTPFAAIQARYRVNAKGDVDVFIEAPAESEGK
jgi:hypothetical protein